MLRQFVINGNELTGSIPAYMGSYPGLGEAWLARNHLSGPLDPLLCQNPGYGDNIHLQVSAAVFCLALDWPVLVCKGILDRHSACDDALCRKVTVCNDSLAGCYDSQAADISG